MMADNAAGDLSDDFINSLPEIGRTECFNFNCGPNVPCFNRCCSELALQLTPYDVLRLRRNLGVSSLDFISAFTEMRYWPDTGFPMPMLKMVEGPSAPCPFVTQAGCSVYEDRPGACRSYPLGRGAKIAEKGIHERFFIIHEEHCRGFECEKKINPEQWIASQELGSYNAFNDKYMRLLSMTRATGKPLDQRLAGMAMLCLYQLDLFRNLIKKMQIFSHVDIADEQAELIMQESRQGDEACLDFALNWLELLIFGKSENLKRI